MLVYHKVRSSSFQVVPAVLHVHGVFCSMQNECEESPCFNGAVCSDSHNGSLPINVYYCNCSAGWHGHNCVEDVDECLSNPCQHGSACFQSSSDSTWHEEVPIDQFACNCTAGWSGHGCTEDVDECLSNPCQNGGTCADSTSSNVSIDEYTCVCPIGVESVAGICDSDINECLSRPCQNGGICFDSSNQPCHDPSHPFILSSDVPCPIRHDEPTYGEFWCLCSGGWSGVHCDDNRGLYDPCHPSYIGVRQNCMQNSTCVYEGIHHEHSCECAFGFVGFATNNTANCTDVDECASEPCNADNSIACLESYVSSTVGGGYFNCSCENGWEGEVCEIDSDECLAEPCENLHRSHTANGTCEASYTDITCVEAGGSSADCAMMFWVAIGRYNCDCSEGFSGLNCGTDIDECASMPCNQTGHNDSDPASCTDSVRSAAILGNTYECSCPIGWSGENCITDINVSKLI